MANRLRDPISRLWIIDRTQARIRGKSTVEMTGHGRIVPDDMRQHHSNCDPVRHIEMSRQRIGQCMGCPQH